MPITINGSSSVGLPDDPRVSLLDLLREELHLSGTKKGCNQGACGACTVLVDGERILSCLALAVQYDGRQVTTIEGLAAEDGGLHPLQQAFIDHDGFQCGYCTPGQICSAIGMAAEAKRGVPSHVSADLGMNMVLTREEVQERMSGNLCRCGAHNGIIDAIRETVAAEMAA
jgi:xanthine dehydrogenase YagT iron-sulfur-binding subunit